ncbi:hypothetical protein ACFE04_015236 [Oxalis oulophora]
MENHIFLLLLCFFLPFTHARSVASDHDPRSLTRAHGALSLANAFLEPHNAARATLNLAPLVWDQTLASYAQGYANERKDDCELIHSNGPYGENIFWGSGSGWKPAQAVLAWMDEGKYYNYESNSCDEGEECGHYTQVVWRDTTSLGCALVNCLGGRGVFVTCNYDPPGNYYGEEPY